MTAGRRRVAGELPAQVGGHPLVARAGRDELRPVGSRDRRHRPLQDRVRRSRGPLHRGVGPGPRPARAARCTRTPARPGLVGARGATADPARRRRRASARSEGAELSATRDAADAPAELATGTPRTVDAPGGHVYQSRAWAEQRARLGWRPRFLVARRRRPASSPSSGRGRWSAAPAPTSRAARSPARRGRRRARGSGWSPSARPLAATGWTSWPPMPRSRPPTRRFAAAIRARRLPRRSRRSSRRATGSPRARRRRRRDAAFGRHREVHAPADPRRRGVGPGRRAPRHAPAPAGRETCSRAPAEPLDDGARPLLRPAARDRRARRLHVRAARRVRGLVAAAHAAGLLVYLEARDGAPSRTAARPASSCIATAAASRRSTRAIAPRRARPIPGVLHLLRWRAIQLAIREGATRWTSAASTSAGARREPVEGEPMSGLYQHKRSFGAQWVEMAGAHERVIRPRRYARRARSTTRVARLRPADDRRRTIADLARGRRAGRARRARAG